MSTATSMSEIAASHYEAEPEPLEGLLRKPSLPRAMRLLMGIAKQWQHGTLRVRLPNGSVFEHKGARPGETAEIRVHNMRLARRFLTGGTIGFAESYIDGDWDSPNLPQFLTVAAHNESILNDAMRGSVLFRALSRLMHFRNRNTKSGSRRNISHHYDLGNDFYQQWLDGSMTYSAARYDQNVADLEQAQHNKYRHLARKLDLGPDHHVLEIGCGWGGFAEYAAKTYGCRVTGITISQEQHDYAAARIQRAGLNEQVDIQIRDYRDLQGQYDRVASIEMFEAVGEAYWPVFFETLRERLSKGGKAALQVITIAEEFWDYYRSRPDFIQRYIFPGGMLPTPNRLQEHSTLAGLSILSEDRFGHHYARTLAEWNDRFQAAWPKISQLGYDGRFKRMWEYYLAYCEAGFRSDSTDVLQIALAKA